MSKRNYAIFDLDNCLADDSERLRLIDWSAADPEARYRPYHEPCDRDAVGREAMALLDKLRERGVVPLFLTARPITFRAKTEAWLMRNRLAQNGTPLILLMRNRDDHRHSVDLKASQLATLRDEWSIPLEAVELAVDDREDVLRMYQSAGITAIRIAIHSGDAYRPPRAGDILRSGAELFAERNAAYGDAYRAFGAVMRGLYPEGLTLRTEAEWNRAGAMFWCVSKLQRYAAAAPAGHVDSARDLAVYAAMLAEVTTP